VTDQPQEAPQQAPTFHTGLDFLNAHLNMAMRLVELAASKNPAELTAMMALELSAAHTDLAQVGSQVAIAESLNGVAAALDRIGIQMQERTALMRGEGVDEPETAQPPVDDPMVLHSAERPL
jgi:hypothetical protein